MTPEFIYKPQRSNDYPLSNFLRFSIHLALVVFIYIKTYQSYSSLNASESSKTLHACMHTHKKYMSSLCVCVCGGSSFSVLLALKGWDGEKKNQRRERERADKRKREKKKGKSNFAKEFITKRLLHFLHKQHTISQTV